MRFRSPSRSQHSAAGFTLVELLVVISTIVVLIALLAPAMDKAVYHAELVACSGKLKALSGTVVQYAFDNRRYYPDRGLDRIGPDSTYLNWINAMKLAHPLEGYDMRPVLRKIMSIDKALQCSLTQQMQLEDQPGPEDDSVSVEASYTMWWGWRYFVPSRTSVNANQQSVNTTQGRTNEKGMYRIGDRFSWDGDAFSILAGDIDLRYPAGTQASHPDQEAAMMTQLSGQNELSFNGRSTLSRWVRQESVHGDRLRGVIDTSFAFDDLSVRRYANVPHMIRNHNARDKRFQWVPVQFDQRSGNPTNQNGDAFQIPLN